MQKTPLETAQKSINAYFTLNSRRCKVLSADIFSTTVHFWFMTVDSESSTVYGWVPAIIVGQCELSK